MSPVNPFRRKASEAEAAPAVGEREAVVVQAPAPATDEPPSPPMSPTSPVSTAPPMSPGSPASKDRTGPGIGAVLRPRLDRPNVVVAVLTALLGFALATQVQSAGRQDLTTLRPTDLVRILGDQNLRAARLDADVRSLERARDQLQNGTTTGKEAVARAQSQLDALAILTGTARATGPGITVTITPGASAVSAVNLLDVVEELRDAGAEAIQIGSARVVAQSALTSKDGALYVGATKVSAPYEIRAIGDTATLQAAMKIPGGIVETLEQAPTAASVSIAPATPGHPVVVDALLQPPTPRYAHPVPAPSPSSS